MLARCPRLMNLMCEFVCDVDSIEPRPSLSACLPTVTPLARLTTYFFVPTE